MWVVFLLISVIDMAKANNIPLINNTTKYKEKNSITIFLYTKWDKGKNNILLSPFLFIKKESLNKCVRIHT